MKRLDAALELLPENCILADIGCDHGKLCLDALDGGKAKKAYACDISAKSLDKARITLKDRNAVCIESDGLENVPSDFTAVAICGMGAETMLEILAGYDADATLVLQPQTKPFEVRKALTERLGYRLVREITAFERKRFYPVMRFERGEGRLDELQLNFGLNAHRPDETLLRMCEELKKKYAAFRPTPKSQQTLAYIDEILKNANK